MKAIQINNYTTLKKTEFFFYLGGLSCLACTHLELINSGIYMLWTVGVTPWIFDQPVTRSLFT
jgi:hypothetical protein